MSDLFFLNECERAADVMRCRAREAQLLANAPLRPAREQKPCDIGLFSDSREQIDIEDLLRRN